MTLRDLFLAVVVAFSAVAATFAAESGGAAQADAAINFAMPDAIIDLGPALSQRMVNDASAPDGVWFTVPIRNSSALPVVRVLAASDSPRAGLAMVPQAKRAALVEVVGADSSLIIERASGFGDNIFRVVLPAAGVSTLALHFQGVSGPPRVFAWMESTLVQHNRQVAILSSTVLGLLAAAAAFALGAAVLSATSVSRWAAIFLTAVLLAEATGAATFDDFLLVRWAGPHGLFALMLGLVLAAAIRLVDRIAPLDMLDKNLKVWRDRVPLGLVVLGLAALAGLPLAGLVIRLLAVIAAVAAAAYFAYCGRAGNAAARRLAPAATIFALVVLAAGCNALGLFGLNLAASGAIGGFSAAGALLVAIAAAVPLGPQTEPVREPLEAGSHTVILPLAKDIARERQREMTAVSASHQGVFDLNLRTGVVSLSAEAAQLLGLPPAAIALSRETWLGRIHADDREVYQEALGIYRRDPGVAFRLEFRARTGGGRTAWFELRASMTGQKSKAERCLGLIANITARKSSEAPAVLPSPNDVLTGLGTRAALLARLDASRGELKQTALAVFDLDRFKAVNDSLGRDDGDALLIALAGRLVNASTEEGTAPTVFFRVGGDMFAAVAQGVSQLDAFGQRLVDVLSTPFSIAEREIYCPVSVGVAAGEHANDAQALLAQAELAMVEAKRQGGSRVCVYSQGLPQAETGDPVALETDLRRALERDEIEVHYQPIVRLKDGAIAGFEALLRWRHPERGMIEPQSFIPQAERSGLIVLLGRCALHRAAQDLARWQRFFPSKPPLYVSVNVTWRQIVDSDFAKELAGLLKAAGLAKGSLRLEVTESALMAGAEEAAAALKRFKTLGAGLAIDDFGTGHSSLSHLTRFPFDTIKIDKSFLAAAKQTTGLKILASIVSLAKELKLSVVAEGVETQEEASRLKEMGCEFGQGFLLGTPVPAAEINGLITSAQAR